VYNDFEIRSKALLVRDAANYVLKDVGLSVVGIYLVGSYARGKVNEWSDLDFLVIVKGVKPQTFPSWKQIQLVNQQIDNRRIHCIYGTDIAVQESLCQKDPVKYCYKEI
jgi:predicted nucleotidyltransferase